jgi:hypothetical protein
MFVVGGELVRSAGHASAVPEDEVRALWRGAVDARALAVVEQELEYVRRPV